MRRLYRQMAERDGFTLVELMIVVAIVAILALIAIPLYSANTVASIMSEGVAGAGAVRSALRVYASANGGYTGATMNNLQIGAADLEGHYFAQSDYKLSGIGSNSYTITAGPPSKTTNAQLTYIINQNGTESGTYKTGM